MEIVVIYVIVLVASCVRCGSCENLTDCSDNCVSKVRCDSSLNELIVVCLRS